MFEKETKFIADFNINKIRKLGAFFTLDGLASAKIHPAIFQYISAELDYLIYLDRKRIIKQSVFDYTLPEVTPHFNSIAVVIKKNKLLPFEEIKNLVVQAVQFNIHLLLQPKRTLTRFIYDTTQQKSTEEVLLLLNYLSYYDFYRKIISEYVEKKNILTFPQDDFETVLNNLTKLLIESQTQAMMDTALNAMADFFNTGDVNKTLIPLGAVELFLKEKNLSVYISKIRTILSADTKRKFEVEDYKNAMYSNIAISMDKEFRDRLQQEMQEEAANPALQPVGRGRFSFTAAGSGTDANTPEEKQPLPQKETISLDELLGPPPPQPKAVSPAQREQTPPQSYIQKPGASAPAQSPIENMFRSINNKPADPIPDEKASEPLTEDVEPPFHLNIPDNINSVKEDEDVYSDETPDTEESSDYNTEPDEASESFSGSSYQLPDTFSDDIEDKGVSSPAEEQPMRAESISAEQTSEDETRDLFSYFSTRDTMRIVEEVFNNDSLDFVSTMESIAECENLDQAQTLLKSVFISYKINSLNNREAKLLINKIEEFFGSR